MSIAENVRAVRERIARAAERAGRDPASVTLVAAAKTMPAERVREAIDAGVTDIGQNYVQEGLAVKQDVAAIARWHLIGHLQRNKAARAAAGFDVVQSIDRLPLAEALSRHSAGAAENLAVLIEVNLGGEASKSGAAPGEVAGLVGAVRRLQGLRVEGLMAIPPAGSESEARVHFRRLCELAAECELHELSMGMTNDFEVAVEEGATMVRVGRAIFGERA